LPAISSVAGKVGFSSRFSLLLVYGCAEVNSVAPCVLLVSWVPDAKDRVFPVDQVWFPVLD
jgi:hypothetical protein